MGCLLPKLSPKWSDMMQEAQSRASIHKSPVLSRVSASEDGTGVLGDCTCQMLGEASSQLGSSKMTGLGGWPSSSEV